MEFIPGELALQSILPAQTLEVPIRADSAESKNCNTSPFPDGHLGRASGEQ